jgi:hypothetical protein
MSSYLPGALRVQRLTVQHGGTAAVPAISRAPEPSAAGAADAVTPDCAGGEERLFVDLRGQRSRRVERPDVPGQDAAAP